MVQKKMMKQDYLDVIKEHFTSKGKRLANVGKAKIDELKDIIKKYNIELDEEDYIKNKNIKIKEEEDYIKNIREKNKLFIDKHRETKEERINVWKELDEDIKNKLIKWFVLSSQMEFIQNYFKWYKHNKELKKSVENIMDIRIKEGKNVERVNANTLNISGITVVFGVLADEEFDIKEATDNKTRWLEEDADVKKIIEYLDKYNWRVVEDFDIVVREVGSEDEEK